jgi:hypothetical protein
MERNHSCYIRRIEQVLDGCICQHRGVTELSARRYRERHILISALLTFTREKRRDELPILRVRCIRGHSPRTGKRCR